MKGNYGDYMMISNLRDIAYDTQYGHIGCKDEVALKKYIRKQYEKQYNADFFEDVKNSRYVKILEEILDEYDNIIAEDIVKMCDKMIDEIGGDIYDDEFE